MVERSRRGGRSRSSTPTPASGRRSPAAGCSAPAATTATTRGTPPHFEGRERFRGPIVHPQQWPDDLDVSGRRVVVIGSGATAVTLVPALATTAAHVDMLQRTPTYVLPVPAKDPIASALRRMLGEERAYPVIRRKNIAQQKAIWAFCRRYPRAARRLIRSVNRKQLPEGYPVDDALQPALRPLDPAPVRGAGRRPVPRHPERHRLGRHRPDHDVHRDRRPARVGRAPGRRRRSSPRPASNRAGHGGGDAHGRRPPGRPRATRSPTRG